MHAALLGAHPALQMPSQEKCKVKTNAKSKTPGSYRIPSTFEGPNAARSRDDTLPSRVAHARAASDAIGHRALKYARFGIVDGRANPHAFPCGSMPKNWAFRQAATIRSTPRGEAGRFSGIAPCDLRGWFSQRFAAPMPIGLAPARERRATPRATFNLNRQRARPPASVTVCDSGSAGSP